METLTLLFFSSLFFAYKSLCAELCKPVTCGKNSPELRFPFYLEDYRTGFCGYRGFGLLCNRSQPVLNLPFTGDYAVKRINYATQDIFVDPGFCRPGRILSFTLRDSPFRGKNMTEYTIYNCSSILKGVMPPAVILGCLSGDDYTIVAKPNSAVDSELPSFCRNVSTVAIPVQRRVQLYGSLIELREDLQLTWDEPDCKYCESQGGICGMKSEREFFSVGCSMAMRPKKGLPRSAKYGIIVGVGIPGLVFVIGLACFTINRVRAISQRRRHEANPLATIITPQQAFYANGLDGSTIESYPKTVLGDSGRLPKPNDGTCAICLAEYLPKDTLRTVPECNHYFHATCIDEWLRLKATCPVCRNTPESSSVGTPCSSVSSSSASSTAS